MNRLSQTGWIRIAAAVAVCLMVALWWSAIWRDVDDTALGRVTAKGFPWLPPKYASLPNEANKRLMI